MERVQSPVLGQRRRRPVPLPFFLLLLLLTAAAQEPPIVGFDGNCSALLSGAIAAASGAFRPPAACVAVSAPVSMCVLEAEACAADAALRMGDRSRDGYAVWCAQMAECTAGAMRCFSGVAAAVEEAEEAAGCGAWAALLDAVEVNLIDALRFSSPPPATAAAAEASVYTATAHAMACAHSYCHAIADAAAIARMTGTAVALPQRCEHADSLGDDVGAAACSQPPAALAAFAAALSPSADGGPAERLHLVLRVDQAAPAMAAAAATATASAFANALRTFVARFVGLRRRFVGVRLLRQPAESDQRRAGAAHSSNVSSTIHAELLIDESPLNVTAAAAAARLRAVIDDAAQSAPASAALQAALLPLATALGLDGAVVVLVAASVLGGASTAPSPPVGEGDVDESERVGGGLWTSAAPARCGGNCVLAASVALLAAASAVLAVGAVVQHRRRRAEQEQQRQQEDEEEGGGEEEEEEGEEDGEEPDGGPPGMAPTHHHHPALPPPPLRRRSPHLHPAPPPPPPTSTREPAWHPPDEEQQQQQDEEEAEEEEEVVFEDLSRQPPLAIADAARLDGWWYGAAPATRGGNDGLGGPTEEQIEAEEEEGVHAAGTAEGPLPPPTRNPLHDLGW